MLIHPRQTNTGAPRNSSPPLLGETPPSVRSGKAVELQRALKAAGLYPFKIDGWFGPKTLAGLKAFQASQHLGETGKAGPESWQALQKQGLTSTSWTDTFPEAPRPALSQLEANLQSSFQAGSAGRTAASFAAAVSGPLRPGVNGMLDWAHSMIGTPYAAVNPFRFGDVPWDGQAHRSENGSGSVWNFPKGTRVFDCSGFVVAAYRKLGVDLASKGLASSSAIRNDHGFLQSVGREALQPGDLITYAPHNGVGHVVIYLGNGQTIEAAGGAGVKVGTVDWSRADSFKRVPV